ncbi:LOW QUALITY PROTEIN: hypothetical protein Cgig2_012370 [Carnegiea gigantea]|uniref:RNase H type-1 domain-containing protein n=1 Tax=Carnegiea gigantea TaxID=171969 RepID=A0A9Q1QLJ5_9CARY|nr:LOW QUALITY PROTEIN: hypothetical protein Cgig2_012370 [Carnegiea gigantea]
MDLGGKGGMGESNEETLTGKPKPQARRSLKDILEAANSAQREDSGESKASSRGKSEIESKLRKGGAHLGIANPIGRSNITMQPMHDKGKAVLIEGKVNACMTTPNTTSNIPVNSQIKTLSQQAPDASSPVLSRRKNWKGHECNSSKSKTLTGSKANARSKRKGADDVVENWGCEKFRFLSERANNLQEKLQELCKKKEPNDAGRCSCWRGEIGCVKINFNGAVDVSRGRAAVGCMARSEEGGFVWATALCFNSVSTSGGACCAFWIEIAKSKGMVGFVIESDDQGLVQCLKKKSDMRGPFSLLPEDIWAQLVDCQVRRILSTRRSNNEVAHRIPKWSLGCIDLVLWDSVPPLAY